MNPIPDEFWDKFWSQTWQVLAKTIFPALVAVSVGIAVKMQKIKVTILSALGSYIIGCGFAFIFGFYIHEHFTQGTGTLLIGALAITGEKIGHWLIFKFEFDELGRELEKWIKKKLK